MNGRDDWKDIIKAIEEEITVVGKQWLHLCLKLNVTIMMIARFKETFK